MRNSSAASSTATEQNIPISGSITVQNKEGDKREIKMQAYSGAAVNLESYGWDHPVVYNIATMKHKSRVPYLYEHKQEIGAGSVTLSKTSVDTEGVLLSGDIQSDKVWNGLNQGFPYEASLGLRFSYSDVKFYDEGEKITVNNKLLEGPIYVIDNTIIKESSVVLFGRDSETEVTRMSEDTLMTIKNSSKKETPPKVTPPPVDDKNKEVDNKETDDKKVGTKTTTTTNNAPPPGVVSAQEVFRVCQLLNKYPENHDLVKKGIENGWADEDIVNSIDLHNLRNGKHHVPVVPGAENGAADQLMIRMASTFGVSDEFLAKKFKDKGEQALSQGYLSVREMVTTIANANGGHFTGHSDIEEACKYIRHIQNTARYSTIDFPTLMHQVGALRVEEAWTIGEPFVTGRLFVDNKSDFNPSKRIRPGGGTMWERLGNDDKIKHGSFGNETVYTAYLDTIAQIVTFSRQTIINNDAAFIDQLLRLMVDGALMVPDFEFVCKIYEGENTGFLVEGVNLLKGAAMELSDASLDTAYALARSRSISKGDKAVQARFGGKYLLVVSSALERKAWELTRPNNYYEGAADSPAAGQQNYWAGRITPVTFEQLDNDTYHADADPKTWMLIPVESQQAPYSISFLNNQRRPITEAISLPADMLGSGIRGYWDVNINERDGDAVVVVIPSQASGLSHTLTAKDIHKNGRKLQDDGPPVVTATSEELRQKAEQREQEAKKAEAQNQDDGPKPRPNGPRPSGQ